MTVGLLLIDIQNDYFPGGNMELAGMIPAAERAASLLALFRQRRLSCVHIRHVSRGGSATFFLPETDGAKLHESILPAPAAPVIEKHFPNSFRDTLLLDTLRDKEIDRLVICGAMSHMCIDATTRAAADLGFDCLVAHDACATRDLSFGEETIPAAKVHGAFMAALAAAYARVLPSDKISELLA
jgi:nicotinamidase-related amidase